MSFWDHMMAGEEVVARAGSFYATNRRVLRYEQTPGGNETFAELPYGRVTAIELYRPPNHRLMATGTAIALAGFFTSMLVGLWTPLLLIPLGVGFIIYGGQGKGLYYQLTSQGATREQQALWRIPYRGSMEFIAAVGDRSGRRPQE